MPAPLIYLAINAVIGTRRTAFVKLVPAEVFVTTNEVFEFPKAPTLQYSGHGPTLCVQSVSDHNS